ncbi:MAG: aminopeptidase P family protein [Anaerovoracaceae bacterium]
MANNTNLKIQKLRQLMKSNNIDAYYIGTDDYHLSEYVGDYFKCREFVSGFTGSAGTLIVTMDQALLWTDGRYFIQAAAEIKGSEVKLQKMGEKNVQSTTAYLCDKLATGQVLGFDGRTVSIETGEELKTKLADKNINFVTHLDLVNEIWEYRPDLSDKPAYLIEEKYVGKSSKDKIKELREALKEKHVDGHVLTTLDDICWLLNIRGNDIDFNPLILAYAYITQDEFILFADKTKFDLNIQKYLQDLNIKIQPYNSIYDFIKTLEDISVLISPEFTNYEIATSLKSKCKVILEVNPTTSAKAVKNQIEIDSTKEIHLKDAVAMIRFIIWLKSNVSKGTITEVSAGKKLFEFRKEQGCFEESFATIAGYQEHGAIVHYEADENSDVTLKPEGFLLVDSGGHYMGGTTDITRTLVLGPVTDTMKLHYTAVLSGMLALGRAVFPGSFAVAQLDVLARMPLWKMGLDYNHGTGHGVGHMLNVHEFPNNINCKNIGYSVPMEVGMINSNEPGLYIEGEYGIRHENEMLTVRSTKGEDLMEFEFITFVPFDIEGLDLDYLSPEDKDHLNKYHKMVFEKISPLLESEEVKWLKNATREI